MGAGPGRPAGASPGHAGCPLLGASPGHGSVCAKAGVTQAAIAIRINGRVRPDVLAVMSGFLRWIANSLPNS
jgi:hypothetical protein